MRAVILLLLISIALMLGISAICQLNRVQPYLNQANCLQFGSEINSKGERLIYAKNQCPINSQFSIEAKLSQGQYKLISTPCLIQGQKYFLKNLNNTEDFIASAQFEC
ncbi:hypothetical protein ABPG74_007822 [Tetrahymena malaccensis]